MAYRLSSHHIEGQSLDRNHLDPEDQEDYPSSDSDEDEEDEDLTWEDWVSDSLSNQPCKSLFDDQKFASVEAALEHDKAAHGFDLNQLCARLGTLCSQVVMNPRSFPTSRP